MGARLLVASVALLLLGESQASAYCRLTTCDKTKYDCKVNEAGCVSDGTVLIWSKLPITYRVYSGGSAKLQDMEQVRQKIRSAFQTWENVQCGTRGRTSVRFQEGDDVSEDKGINDEEAPEKFGVYFRDESWPHHGGDTLALTNQHYGVKTGTITYADIEVNTADYDFVLQDSTDGEARQAKDFLSVMTHEAGHYLGLDHSPKEGSIMAPHYCEGDRCSSGSTDEARALSADDIAGVCALYPPPGGDDTVVKAGGCSTTPSHDSRDAFLAIAIGFGLVVTVRRRIRARSMLD